jgi:type I restriction enzyme S subunit
VLKDFCDVEYGKALPEKIRIAGGSKVFGSAGLVGSHKDSLYNEPLIVVGRKGNISGVHKVDGPSWVIDTAYAIRPRVGLERDYLFYFLRLHAAHLASMDQSTAVPSLAREVLYSLPLVPPSVLEQRKVVKKIEALFAEIDAGTEELKQTKAKLELYKQAVLNSAIQGKLVPQDPNDEPASKLLERIRAEKEKLVKEGKIKKEKLLPPIDPSEVPFEVPKGWEWVRLKDLIAGASQGWSPKCYETPSTHEASWGVIKTTAIQPMRFNSSENKELPQSLEPRTQHELNAGDILITRAGPRSRVGICCMVHSVRGRLLLCDKAYRIRTVSSLILPQFIELVLNSPLFQRILDSMKTGINDSGLNLTQDAFVALPFPVPPVNAQKAIVEKARLSISETEGASHSLEDFELAAVGLKQSILKTAFCGNLL